MVGEVCCLGAVYFVHSSLPQLIDDSVARNGLADLGLAGLQYGTSARGAWSRSHENAMGLLREKERNAIRNKAIRLT
jgi:hypothetical protein